MALKELEIVYPEEPASNDSTDSFASESLFPFCPSRFDVDKIRAELPNEKGEYEEDECFMWTTLSGINKDNVGDYIGSSGRIRNSLELKKKIDESAQLVCKQYYNLRYVPVLMSYSYPTEDDFDDPAYIYNIKGYFDGREVYKDFIVSQPTINRALELDVDTPISLENFKQWAELRSVASISDDEAEEALKLGIIIPTGLGWDSSKPFTVNHLYPNEITPPDGLNIYPEPYERTPCSSIGTRMHRIRFFQPYSSILRTVVMLYYKGVFVGYSMRELSSWNPTGCHIGADSGSLTGTQATICVGNYILYDASWPEPEEPEEGEEPLPITRGRNYAYITIQDAHFVCEATALGRSEFVVDAENMSASASYIIPVEDGEDSITAATASIDGENIIYWDRYE